MRSMAMSWCQLGLHKIFELAGDSSLGKLARQLISYNLLISNLGAARQLVDRMSFIQRNNKYSRFLAYCIAIRTGCREDAQSCLNTITNTHGQNDQLLLACVGESIQHGQPFDTVRLLQRISENHLQTPSSLDVRTLLKYTCRILIGIATDPKPDLRHGDEVLVRLCKVFSSAAALQKKTISSSTGKHSAVEMADYEWFREQSLYLGKHHLHKWPRRFTIDVLQYSQQLYCPKNGTLDSASLSRDQWQGLRDTTFIQAVLYAAEARTISSSCTIDDLPQTSYDTRSKPKPSEYRLVLYQKVFKSFSRLEEWHKSMPSDDHGDITNLQSQLLTLLPVAFEALLFMNTSEYLSNETGFDEVSIKQLLGVAAELEASAAIYALLADVLLVFASTDVQGSSYFSTLQIPSTVAARTMGLIIQALRLQKSYNFEQASRWIRCIAQLILVDIEKAVIAYNGQGELKCDQNLKILDSVIQQAMALAQLETYPVEVDKMEIDSQEEAVSHPPHYPREELQWLSTKVFNLAIDFLALDQNEKAQRWASKALEVAKLLDSGSERGTEHNLSNLLRNKMNDLDWNIARIKS